MAIVMSPNLFQIGAASMDNPMAALTMAQKVLLTCAYIRVLMDRESVHIRAIVCVMAALTMAQKVF